MFPVVFPLKFILSELLRSEAIGVALALATSAIGVFWVAPTDANSVTPAALAVVSVGQGALHSQCQCSRMPTYSQ